MRQVDVGQSKQGVDLGVMLHHGHGLPEDDREAVQWKRLATGQAHADAPSRSVATDHP